MPIPINRNPDASYGIFGTLRNLISPPGYVSRGPRGSLPPGGVAPTDAQLKAQGYGFGVREYDPLETRGRPSVVRSAPTLPSAQKSPASERAYQQEVSRVAQLTAQNPELQRYERATKEAMTAGPGSAAEQSAEDMGMQIWAKANPKLAAKVKPGQSGYDAIQRMQGAGQMGSLLNLPFDTSSPLGTTPPVSSASYDGGKVAQGLGLSALPSNAFAGASATPYTGFSQGQTLQSAPLGMPTETPNAAYAGAAGIQPIGTALEQFDPKSAQAQKFLEMFKNPAFTR